MSLELKIEALTQAVIALTAKIEAVNVTPSPVTTAAAVQAAPLAQPVAAAPASVTPTNPAPSQPAVVAMPTFAPTPTVPVASGAPFVDGKGLIEYVMGAYKAMGPQKGAAIQGVLTQMGYQNINDVKPEHYAAFYAGVEALK
jgi:hypothetical protein